MNTMTTRLPSALLLFFAAIVDVIPQSTLLSRSNPLTVFSCSFQRDTCNMKNQEAARGLWLRKVVFLGNVIGPAMVVNGNSAKNHFARLLTPDIPTLDSETACLKFTYFIAGRSAPSLSVIKQGYTTEYVFTTAYLTQNKWQQALVDVNLYGDIVMFYFEADTKVQQYGESVVAIKDVQFTLAPCERGTSLRRRYRANTSKNY